MNGHCGTKEYQAGYHGYFQGWVNPYESGSTSASLWDEGNHDAEEDEQRQWEDRYTVTENLSEGVIP